MRTVVCIALAVAPCLLKLIICVVALTVQCEVGKEVKHEFWKYRETLLESNFTAIPTLSHVSVLHSVSLMQPPWHPDCKCSQVTTKQELNPV